MFESQQKRQAKVIWALSFIPDFVIAGVFTMLFDNEEPLFTFFAVWLALQAAGLLLWTRNTIWSWLVWSKMLRRPGAERIASVYRAAGFPPPLADEQSAESYLSRVADDDALAINVRLLAARELGALGYPAPNGHVMESLRLAMVAEDAIDKLRAA